MFASHSILAAVLCLVLALPAQGASPVEAYSPGDLILAQALNRHDKLVGTLSLTRDDSGAFTNLKLCGKYVKKECMALLPASAQKEDVVVLLRSMMMGLDYYRSQFNSRVLERTVLRATYLAIGAILSMTYLRYLNHAADYALLRARGMNVEGFKVTVDKQALLSDFKRHVFETAKWIQSFLASPQGWSTVAFVGVPTLAVNAYDDYLSNRRLGQLINTLGNPSGIEPVFIDLPTWRELVDLAQSMQRYSLTSLAKQGGAAITGDAPISQYRQ